MSSPHPEPSLLDRITRLEDLEAIRKLDAQYCRHLDDGNWDALMELFTDDGEFDGLSHPKGKEEMRTFFAGLASGGLTSFWHFITNLEIDLDGDRATVRSFLWQPCVTDGTPAIAAGRYNDEVVKVDGRWLYKVKQVRFHFFGPLEAGWDENLFALDSARGAAVRA
ncbi:nuclear transport factor 2 family protein [Rhodococcus rhodochrous]|uniref:nuclear transport factor 2 family protein n=1 Tax=Rhodococcus rhodochrous TaxID=1829 RepID=UPI001E5CE442|nr:nuclear transport factor 2 family protein [Rhodococcus rhodochrous]MCD2097380.1 nuclear transport factor 2 family protein [Rhodococcus rhodochrous]MCD2122704.1 nuclear transport factor 2 family protein [Rhodococcus rhodochrous]MCQ4133492.1 nuclear transport factor 2 family protein [Rhodococcus rhodochrous]MDJ0017996.1 nuclear transport factor 2 family protein [Rhodococcus rhodochrous]